MFGFFTSIVSLAGWISLARLRGDFWRAAQERLQAAPSLYDASDVRPSVVAVVPARNEAAVVERSLRSVLNQWYQGELRAVVVDDASDDGTGDLARKVAVGAPREAAVINAPPRPTGWTGKLWALESGVRYARENLPEPKFWLFTDADVRHQPEALEELVSEALAERRSLVSRMVMLHCRGTWEALLIPAFVFFFCKLYPFAWVRDPVCPTAAAAGGCVLVSDEALREIGGLHTIAGALIDDCTLARAVKSRGYAISLSLTERSESIRPYESLGEIWNMVARTAYTQLGYSPLLLAGTVAGMMLLYATPPLALARGIQRRKPLQALAGGAAWALMSRLYAPMIRLYRRNPLETALLPLAALLYTGMTLDSARRRYFGHGAAWKGRSYDPSMRSRIT
jgi:hopene-associated glycosyltransferase HpnB